jgi:nucleoside-diphosphate kinase
VPVFVRRASGNGRTPVRDRDFAGSGGRPYPHLPVKNRTFVMCKPDAVERGLVGEIVARLERKGLTLVAADLRTVDRPLAEQHYDEHRDKPFFGDLVDFVTRSPVFPMVIEGPDENTWLLVRTLVGATKATEAEPGSIRGDFATITTENLVHASDGHDSAAREIALWFPGLG